MTGRVRLYGIELEHSENKTMIPIWFCGYSAGSTDHRMGSRRIFHIPGEGIVQRGEVDQFKFEGYQVEWFDVEPGTRLLEECFIAFEASSFLDNQATDTGLTTLERLHGVGSPHLLPHLRGRIGGDVPIVIPLDPPGPSPVPIIIPLNPPGPSPVPIIIPLDPPRPT